MDACLGGESQEDEDARGPEWVLLSFMLACNYDIQLAADRFDDRRAGWFRAATA